MENTENLSLEQIRAFLQASQEVRFEATRRQETYEWVTRLSLAPYVNGYVSEGVTNNWNGVYFKSL